MKYELTMVTTFIIETDNMEDALLNMEFPIFPTLDEDSVEFDSNRNTWKEIEDES